MRWPRFFDQVPRRLERLIVPYGFRVVYLEYHPELYGDCTMVFESGEVRLRAELDRAEVGMSIGPISAPLRGDSTDLAWFDVGLVVSFLTDGAENWALTMPDPPLSPDERVDEQLRRLADLALPHWTKVLALFSAETPQQERERLAAYRTQAASRFYYHPEPKGSDEGV